jgi:hypothetical protein
MPSTSGAVAAPRTGLPATTPLCYPAEQPISDAMTPPLQSTESSPEESAPKRLAHDLKASTEPAYCYDMRLIRIERREHRYSPWFYDELPIALSDRCSPRPQRYIAA